MIFVNKSPYLIKLFAETVKRAFGQTPTSVYQGKRAIHVQYLRREHQPMIKELLHDFKTFKTADGTEPSLSYLLHANRDLKIDAIRTAMSCDGTITTSFYKGRIMPELQFTCRNKHLIPQWQELFNSVGINMRIHADRKIDIGMRGLRTGSRKAFSNFREIGFLEEATVIKHSVFIGYTKNLLFENAMLCLKNAEEYSREKFKHIVDCGRKNVLPPLSLEMIKQNLISSPTVSFQTNLLSAV